MARTLVALALAVALVTAAAVRVEADPIPLGQLGAMVALGLLPALAVLRGRSHRIVAAVTGGCLLVAASIATGVPLSGLRPPDADRDFLAPAARIVNQGILDFWETQLPFARADFPLMHSVVLLAVFASIAGAGIFLAAGRPVPGAIVLVVAFGWPATLVAGERPLAFGALALAVLVGILFLLREGGRPLRGVTQGLAVGLALVLAAAAASTSDAVAKGAFLDWQSWDPYDRPEEPVGVRYVWNSHYLGISFPEKETTVFKVRVQNPRRLYWRATTLEVYTGRGWQEELTLSGASEPESIAPSDELAGLLPDEARDESNWVRQDVTVGALRDEHLIASAQPMRWRPPESATVQDAGGEVVVLPRSLRQGQRYTVWSYVSQAKPRALAAAGTEYPEPARAHLRLLQTLEVPGFGVGSRSVLMDALFDRAANDFLVSAHRPLYERAREVVGEAESPYAAAVALEAWFRSEGGFIYDEQPPGPSEAEPALVSFVLGHQRGYCQLYAGAMAVMLRLLGVPARVAAGFTSGSYDQNAKEWTVTDHNAHTWVEVFFPGFGWLPFDPTPGRGVLAAPYSAVSPEFDTGEAADVFTGGSEVLDAITREALRAQGRPGLEGIGGLGPNPGGSGGAGAVVREEAPSLVGLALLLVAGGLASVAGLKVVRRTLRFARRDPRALATACRRDLIAFLSDQGIAVPASATLGDLGRIVEREFAFAPAAFVEAAGRARFGPPREAERALRRARRELRSVRAQIRGELDVPSRLRGAVSLRSLAL